MPIETRIFKNTKKSIIFLKQKFDFLKKNFSISVLFLFIGFFLGNVFGTFLNGLRDFIVWDGLLVFGLLSLFEIISSIVYQNNPRAYGTIAAGPAFLPSPVLTNKTSFSDFFITKNIFLKMKLPRRKLKKANRLKTSSKSTNQFYLQISYKKLRNLLTINSYFLKSLPIWRLLNCLKVGILFGFFIDAFKVGS